MAEIGGTNIGSPGDIRNDGDSHREKSLKAAWRQPETKLDQMFEPGKSEFSREDLDKVFDDFKKKAVLQNDPMLRDLTNVYQGLSGTDTASRADVLEALRKVAR